LALNAQTRQVSGTVTSAEDGLPLPGVSIVVDGLTLGTLSDFEGRYTLDVPANATRLVFSFVGMKTLTVSISGPVVNATLEPDVLGLEEVMVVAYGTVRKESLSGSAAVIDSKKLEGRSVSSMGEILIGSTSGYRLTAASGQPGSFLISRSRVGYPEHILGSFNNS
jgi:hypothetical protein